MSVARELRGGHVVRGRNFAGRRKGRFDALWPGSMCPSCDGLIELDKGAKPGQLVECPWCYLQLKLIGENPVTFDILDYEEILQLRRMGR